MSEISDSVDSVVMFPLKSGTILAKCVFVGTGSNGIPMVAWEGCAGHATHRGWCTLKYWESFSKQNAEHGRNG